VPKKIRTPITGEWVKRREAILVAQEDAAIRAARDDAASPEERAFAEAVIAVRERRRGWERAQAPGDDDPMLQ
jgi:hypothetical protein